MDDLYSLLDKAIDPNFVATLAGLSLAAYAFFSPQCDKLLKDAKSELSRTEDKVHKGKDKGINAETPNSQRILELNQIIKSINDAVTGLLKAFIIFSVMLIYTISIDQVINKETLDSFFGIEDNSFFALSDIIISYIFLSSATIYLYKGVFGIKKFFKVSFNDDKKQAIEFIKNWQQKKNDKSV